MCGIAGEYFPQNKGGLSLLAMEKATDKQQTRGPDGSGIYYFDNLMLGHRRLKIFDLSNRAMQPMIDHTLGLALVFNGEIYNFAELRENLESKGYQFTSNSDTEVLLKAYHAWGTECVSRLHGMFAFAIWERETGKIILARDRMGIKPLYFSTSSQGIQFASTLPALLEFEGIDTTIDKVALHYYLMFHVVPEPLTILSGIKKLRPGYILTMHPDGKIEQHCYWRLSFNETNANHARSELEWIEMIDHVLMKAIHQQLAADVPVGILLSGGLDSSLLVALAARNHQRQIETFSIGFENGDHEIGNEFVYSNIIAKHYHTHHHQLFISNAQLFDSISTCVESMSEPMISHDNIAFYLLSQEVAKHVKVVLSGQGADEILGGYHWFQNIPHQQYNIQQITTFILNKIADRSYAEYSELIMPEYRTDSFYAESYIENLCQQNGSPYPLDNLLAYESGFALSNGPLCRVDNMTMAASLEARVPFLDEKLVNLAMTIPKKFKLDGGGKYILKQLGRKLLPREVIDRPKGYFPVPALKYLNGGMLTWLRDVLSPKNVKARGIFNPDVIQKMLNSPKDHFTPTGASKLWQLGLLEYWLKKQNIGN